MKDTVLKLAFFTLQCILEIFTCERIEIFLNFLVNSYTVFHYMNGNFCFSTFISQGALIFNYKNFEIIERYRE